MAPRTSLSDRSPRATASPQLVLADEHRLFVDALALTLARRGYGVRGIATTRTQLLRAVLVHRPDACVLDIQLLDGPAIDVIDRIHARLPKVKVLVVSARTDADSVAAAMEAGAVGYLSKRQGVDVIDHALAELSRGELTIEPSLAQETLRHLGNHRDVEDQPLRWLTQRELEVLRRLTDGEGTTEIAQALGVTINTARTHVQNVLDKLGVHSRLEAVALADRAPHAPSLRRMA
ncbi:response regulator transcription factor [Streptomyces sp. ISL-98]|uniref:response regulator n=1 Tax=Streptomyces sp. ISL-98 TaxID=2819192 RepID=UPI001BE9A4DA|nr:response regulator transcription factor [Streptomyces sp. ISL-98]MBT2508920.1 response regulator transcription factor [Streptomyces sp. ISL-98]